MNNYSRISTTSEPIYKVCFNLKMLKNKYIYLHILEK